MITMKTINGIDVIKNRDADFNKEKLICFDMDGTLIDAEALDILAQKKGVGR